MTTGFIYDERCLNHDTGMGHPERADRLRAVIQGLTQAGLYDRLEHLDFEPVDTAYVERLHNPPYVRRCFEYCREGVPFVDTPDSAVCTESADIALLAAGGVRRAVDGVMAGEIDNAFCALRPPGHHAEAAESMGFCLFCNIALAADYLIRDHGLERVAIVDFDVHHGNGTQHLLEDRGDILFISVHQDPATLFPGTGAAHETGTDGGEGFTLNLPLPPQSGDSEYAEVFDAKIIPALDAFKPQFLLVSAGFDAATSDPLAQMNVSTEGFAAMSQQLVEVAKKHCGGRLVSTLEGGYDLEALSQGVNAHVRALLDG